MSFATSSEPVFTSLFGWTNGRMRATRIGLFAVFFSSVLTPNAFAANLPFTGSFGTVAMCIIDAFTDIPSSEINFNVGGAPLARVMPGEFDTPSESCVFQKVTSRAPSGAERSWDVAANCTADQGNSSLGFQIALDKGAGTVTVVAKDGKVLATLDQCSLPYAERLARELKRMPVGAAKK